MHNLYFWMFIWNFTSGEFDTTKFIAPEAPGISFASCVRSNIALFVASSVQSSVLELSHLFLTSFLAAVDSFLISSGKHEDLE